MEKTNCVTGILVWKPTIKHLWILNIKDKHSPTNVFCFLFKSSLIFREVYWLRNVKTKMLSELVKMDA